MIIFGKTKSDWKVLELHYRREWICFVVGFIYRSYNMSLSNKSFQELEIASQEWSEWHKKVIVLDEGRKATYSKCFLKHKLDSKTVIEAEHKARTDEEYKAIVEQYAIAEEQLIKARYHYNNLDKYISLLQSELKRDLALTGKQPV
jgi:hypothetical protein